MTTPDGVIDYALDAGGQVTDVDYNGSQGEAVFVLLGSRVMAFSKAGIAFVPKKCYFRAGWSTRLVRVRR